MKHLYCLGAFGALLALAACATAPKPADVAALEVGLTTAERAAIVYIQLPPCGGMTAVCSDAGTVAKIKAADQVAHDAIVAARGGSSLSAAIAALVALQTAIPVFSGAR